VTRAEIESAEKPLPPPPPPADLSQPPLRPDRFNPFEQSLTPRRIRQIQTALCVTPADGELGPHGSRTRQAVRQYRLGRAQLLAGDNSDVVTPRVGSLLSDAVDEVGSCAGKGLQNSYEVGAYGVPAARMQSKIESLQDALKEALSQLTGVDFTPATRGKFDPATRKAIADIRRAKGINPGLDGQMDQELRRQIQ
jgi:hypothetical protein